MASNTLATVVNHLHTLAVAGKEEPSDGQLLGHFAQSNDPKAFESLVRRHGAMVRGVCQRVLGPGACADCDDVFQATFLVLARKAGSIRKQASVGSWLYGVARRVALHVKCSRTRRQARECDLSAAQEAAQSNAMHVDPVSRASLREIGRAHV